MKSKIPTHPNNGEFRIPDSGFRIPNRPQFALGECGGSVIVVVLLFVVLLSFIVVAFMEDAVSRIKYFSLFHQKDDLRVEAYSALETTLAVINEFREIEGTLWGPAQGWGNPIEYAGLEFAEGVRIKVNLIDESGKFSVNELDYETWIEIFQAQGMDLNIAEELADSLLDWTDEDDLKRLNGFDAEDYESADLGYRPANGPIQTWEEILLIPAFQEVYLNEEGNPRPIWDELKSSLVLESSGPVNLNSATDLVEATLVEMGVLNQYALTDWRNGADGIPGTEDDRLLREGNTSSVVAGEGSSLVSTQIQLLKVEVEAARGDARFLLSALVQWSGANPAAAGNSRDQEGSESGSSDEATNDANEDSAASRRQQARGNTRTEPATAAQLGYPFRILRLTENRRI